MRRHEIGIVVRRLRVDRIAARRLDADDDIAEAMDGEAEGAVGKERIVLRRAPAGGQRSPGGFRKCVEEGAIVGERERLGSLRAGRAVGALQQPRHQRGRLREVRPTS